ncbi:uncharacterized protein N0V89_005544 [Didymosphaeria variabile]|uniref:Uncharacterized protein n=1 Tax=Didymosphaeria variabile TaxID=1932322 RepID=A0A9W9CBK7_9PLEO|nr:uncharacterized protein N0V89_005544 [Didymosphaeria variabile]KAJ4353814.1 hypothetical protein N0V89_005544 [Didymosphaeria variabile]
MPPKNTASAKADGSTGVRARKEGGKFSWTAENERKVHLLPSRSHHVPNHRSSSSSPTHSQPSPLLNSRSSWSIFPARTNMNGIKIRYSRLRIEKNKLAEEYGFAGIGNGALTGEDRSKETPNKITARGKKRASDGEDGATTPVKKGKREKMVENEAPSNDLGEVKKEEEDEI